jgi:hypothetical protein
MRIGEQHAASRESIDVGRRKRALAAHAFETAVQIIDRDKPHVRSLGCHDHTGTPPKPTHAITHPEKSTRAQKSRQNENMRGKGNKASGSEETRPNIGQVPNATNHPKVNQIIPIRPRIT